MAIALNLDGRAEAVLHTTLGLFHMWQTAPNGDWSGWYALATYPPQGGAVHATDTAMTRNHDGRLEVFYVSPIGPGVAKHIWQETAGAGWSPSYALEAGAGVEPISAVGAYPTGDGISAMFMIQSSLGIRLANTMQGGPGYGSWTPIEPLHPA